jgi:acyl-CoA thioester hydrolase
MAKHNGSDEINNEPARDNPEIQVDIRWTDVDAYGHVSHIALVAIAEHARSRWIDCVLGVAPSNWPYVAVHLTLDFRATVGFTDRTVCGSFRPTVVGESSVRLRETFSTADGRLIAEGESVIVAWDEALSVTRPLSEGEAVQLARFQTE